MPIYWWEGDGPKLRGRVDKLEGNRQLSIPRFSDSNNFAGLSPAGGWIVQDKSLPGRYSQAHFKQTAVGIYNQREGFQTDRSLPLHFYFDNHSYLQQYSFAPPPARRFHLRPQAVVLASRTNFTLVTRGFS